MVPTMLQRSITHLMLHISLREGILVFTRPLVPATPSSADRRFLALVCLSTSVTANKPISTGIISIPASSCELPKVRRATPAIGS